MDNLWILTEERPKPSVILQILKLFCDDFSHTINAESNNSKDLKIKPIIKNGLFQFTYIVENISVHKIDKIFIKTVSGSSSFFDFLVVKQENEPIDGQIDNLIMAIEETKTSDDESRNTGVYQRASKFAFIDPYTTTAKLYMLYNDELEAREEKRPSDTSIFGTNMLLTIGAKIEGKQLKSWFKPFETIDELIEFKSNMRKPPTGNVPIEITKCSDKIEISGRLAKPADAGNIGHDPNIGALSLIAKTLRTLGWDKDIVITEHGVTQNYINKTKGKNKFIYICNILDITLKNIILPKTTNLPSNYWHYEQKSEKLASILLHVMGEYHGLRGIYQNHAGCERGYYKTHINELIALPKKDTAGVNLYLPDLVLHDSKTNAIILVEGKQLSTLNAGIEEIQYYDSIENEYIKKHYPNCHVHRCVSIFGGELNNIPHEDILLYLTDSGKIYINKNAPKCIKDIFATENILPI